MVAASAKPELHVNTVEEWERWLESGPDPDGVRLRVRKVASNKPGITYAEALDAALCFGWIDGQKQSLDADYFLQVFTPRRPRGVWSKVNIEHVARLIEEGRMRPAGHREIERAKADGRWDAAYGPSSTAEVPPELRAALDRSPKAKAFFETLRGANRYALIYRVHTAKKAETKAKRVADFIARLERGETIHQAAKKKRS